MNVIPIRNPIVDDDINIAALTLCSLLLATGVNSCGDTQHIAKITGYAHSFLKLPFIIGDRLAFLILQNIDANNAIIIAMLKYIQNQKVKYSMNQ
jgi:hypothetical protein